MRPFRLTARPTARLAVPAARAALVALATSACFSEAPPPAGPVAPMAVTVEAGSTTNTFTPSTVTIQRGGSVTWTIGSRRHNVVFFANPAAPAGIEATTNVTVTRTFAQAGTYPYNCSLHAGMTGTVQVR